MESKTRAFEIDSFIESNREYFDAGMLDSIRAYINNSGRPMSDFQNIKFKSPVLGTILSIFLGLFGIDRFYAGNYVMGAIKLFTYGGCCIWYFVDWFLIGKSIRQQNMDKLSDFIVEGVSESKNKIDISTLKTVVGSDEFKSAAKDVVGAFKDLSKSMDID